MSNQEPPVAALADAPAGACCPPPVCAPLSEEEAGELAPLFKAIADPVRLRLLSLIACHRDGEVCVCELTDAFELTAPTISHHLKVLKQAGLVDSERRGTWVYYRIDPRLLERLSTILHPRLTAAASR
ncbi:ArsR/SmtB family transcription factor [Thermomonospora catenispora]|uniref:ArsR/SmtB family transcription factor n=1 Tax=Thermomonospora catenispora TaxID=2493090 RepID=UPI001124343D|nr:metalloregulator ArsR/SmtB family transcription factor [Thermomonospora catenispora]TNY35920.1 ArsR family transcriptional regulator [Thermomonospora catenispora]